MSHTASGQHLVKALTHSALQIQKKYPSNKNITLQWVAGHREVLGNELVDAAAKEAARGTSSPQQTLPLILQAPLPHNISTL